jgi:hypothetical protein
MKEPQPQQIATPKGYRLGWKVVNRARKPIIAEPIGRAKFLPYKVGSEHTAITGRNLYQDEFKGFKTASDLQRLRMGSSAVGYCLPGIHVCTSVQAAYYWVHWNHHSKIIPVAYRQRDVVGKKSGSVVVVYKMKVLG